ncbi:MAG: 16S rRNA (guanine(527)-N(7))-methyltransferase RsmG [Burkholderiales bacterium]|jgi:16S rRNA (guanine527-N7)-methyltransferase
MNTALSARCAELGLSVQQTEQLQAYLELLQKWNKVYNLTALRDGEKMLTHHIFDSLSLLPSLRQFGNLSQKRILDVGSGAGLPGVVLAIANPEMVVTCIDSVGKKTAFIQQVAASLKLPKLASVHARVEQWSSQPFQIIISRAFSSLADFVRLSFPHLAQDGVWLAMKGKMPSDELTELPSQIEVFHVEQLQIPELAAERRLVWMRRAQGS